MEIDPPPPTFGPTSAFDALADVPKVFESSSSSIPTSTGPSSGRSRPVASAPLPTRTLRTRPSDPVSYVLPGKIVQHASPAGRDPTEEELGTIKRRLGEEGVRNRRDELVKEKEKGLKDLIEGHDAAVREKFHLERFISLLEGYDPEVCLDLAALVSSNADGSLSISNRTTRRCSSR